MEGTSPDEPPAPPTPYAGGFPPAPPPGDGAALPRPRRSKVVPIVAILLILALAGAGLFLLAGRDGGTPASDSPEAAARGFFEAGLKRDCNRFFTLLSAGTRQKITVLDDRAKAAGKTTMRDQLCRSLQNGDFTLNQVKLKSTDGNRAVVAVTTTDSSGTTTDDLQTVKEPEGWRVDLTSELPDSLPG